MAFNRSKYIFFTLCAGIFLTTLHCSSLRRIQNDLFSPVNSVVSNASALRGKTHLVLTRITSKNVKPDESLTANFRDNLRFELLRAGFTVEFPREAPVADKSPSAAKNAKEPGGDEPVTRPTTSASTKRGLVLRGYIFEARTGELLDEEISTGIYISVHPSGGPAAAHLRYIGDTSLATYADSAEAGRLFANQLKTLTKSGEAKSWWRFW